MKRPGPKITGIMQDEITRRVDAIALALNLDPLTVVRVAEVAVKARKRKEQALRA